MSDTYAGLKLITAPSIEPITIAQAEAYLRLDTDLGGPVDTDIALMITSARRICESTLRRGLLTQTWQLSLKNWPGRDYQNWPSSVNSGFDAYYRYDHIRLPFAAQLQSVVSVQYTDTSGTVFTMPPGNIAGGYNVDKNFEPGRIVLPFSQIWPTNILLPGAPIQITYACGSPDVTTLAATFEGYANTILAMWRLIGYYYENKIPPDEMRRSSIAAGVQFVVNELLTEYRIFV